METGDLLGREAILSAADLEPALVEVPEWGGTVRVRALTAAERDAFEASLFEGEGAARRRKLDNLRARLVALSLVDEGGRRLFSDDDAQALGRKSAAALDRVFAVVQRLNRLTAAEVEALAKN